MRTSAVVLIFVTVGNGYYFKFLRLRRKLNVRVCGLPALALARAVDPWRWSGEENALGVKYTG